MKLEVIGVGDAMVDLNTRAPTIPTRGGNVWSTAVQMSPGGTVANVTANLSRLGIKSAFIGCFGQDPYGKYALQVMRENQVDVAEIELIADANTGIVLAVIDDTGERTFIACAKGSSYSQLSEAHIRKVDFSRAKIVQSSGVCLVEEPSRSSVLLAMELAREQGCEIYYDPNLRLQGDYFPEDLKIAQIEALKLSDAVLIGDEELALMFDSDLSLEEAVKHVFALGPDIVVVKQGSSGASVFTREEQFSRGAFPVQVVDTTGAGDAFDAGFIAAMIRKLTLQQALDYANAVAALNVTQVGARTIPLHSEVLEFIRNIADECVNVNR